MMIRFAFITFLLPLYTCCAQIGVKEFNSFKNNFDELSLPVAVDQIVLENLSLSNEISYNEIKKFFVDEHNEPLIEVLDTSVNKFFSYGKISFEGDKLGLLFSLVSNNDNTVHIGIFDRKGRLQWFSTLGSSRYCASLILNDFSFIKFEDLNEKNIVDIDIFNPNSEYLFSSYKCNDYLPCKNFAPKINEIPFSNNLNMKVDSLFFKRMKFLIPYRFCSPYATSQVLSSINGERKLNLSSYFLGSKLLDDESIIVFFLNNYTYQNYQNVKEVGYQVFSKDGKLLIMNSLAEYVEEKNGEVLLNQWAEVKDTKDGIEIIKHGFEKIDVLKF